MTHFESFAKDAKEIAEQPSTLKDLLIKSQVRLSDTLTKAPALISIFDDGELKEIFTAGNISVIKGQAKSRKSFACSLFCAAALNPNFRKIRSTNDKMVILFDTEMSSFYVQRNVWRIAQLADTRNFMAFCLRPYPPEKRLQLIEYCLYNVPKIGYVVIDGIRDLIKDINSAEESTMISSKLLKWTEETGCHISNVLHENKADGKARGHIGTELINKAETVLKIEKCNNDKTRSSISGELTRGLSFEDIYFYIEDGIPKIDNDFDKMEFEKPKF